MKKKHGVLVGFVVLLIATIFTAAGCDSNGGGGGDDSELAKWAGTWNSIHDYYDDPELDQRFQEYYDTIPNMFKPMWGLNSVEDLRNVAREVAETDFDSFVIKGDVITFYDQEQTQKNPSGNVIETVTYTYQGILQDLFMESKGGTGWHAFEGNTNSNHKYLIFSEVERNDPNGSWDGPLNFHIRYGDTSFEALLNNSTEFTIRAWYPTIISYNTTIDDLKALLIDDD
jgi:Zn/Cd-binding protein ZinT